MSSDALIGFLIVLFIFYIICYLIYLSIKLRAKRFNNQFELTNNLVNAIKKGGSNRENSFSFE